MTGTAESWTICIGRWRGTDVRLHLHFPLLALILFLVAPSTALLNSTTATLTLAVLFFSSALHELARVVTAARIGGHTTTVILSPIGGLTKPVLPPDPPAYLVVALAGPVTYLVLMVIGGCSLALEGDRHFLLLLNPLHPQFNSSGLLVGQLVVWVNWCLLLACLLPVDPCDGAELLRGVLWPMVGRSTAMVTTGRVAVVAGVLTALLAILALNGMFLEGTVLGWFPLAFVSVVLLYGGMQKAYSRRYDGGLLIEEFESDDEGWLVHEWDDEDREAVLVEHLQDKQQEAIDRKRRRREASEDARVDAILARLTDTSLDQLSEEEQAILKRASRRYRQRRSSENDNS